MDEILDKLELLTPIGKKVVGRLAYKKINNLF